MIVKESETCGGLKRKGRGGRPPPIDRMHLKTKENFARKCTIFA